ncbi:MAG: Rrf2 family transcriptional regulator [Proteobacteria bacterium]|nr:Rrf2 family transcriptional regulator [Pseudomonadota bacterium]
MKLRTRERYSLRMIMAIAKLSSDENPVGLGVVSHHCGISRRYLEQLVTPLKNASLVRALSGRGGGYTLDREASDITVNDVIKAAVGPVAIVECAVNPTTCMLSEFCSCQALWALINRKITNVLDEYTVADLLDEKCSIRLQKELKDMI